MFAILIILICVTLVAISLSLFSKSAAQRARAATELFYANQIREEVEMIRLGNEKQRRELTNMEYTGGIRVKTEDSFPVYTSTLDESLQEDVSQSIPYSNHEVYEELKEVELDSKTLDFFKGLEVSEVKSMPVISEATPDVNSIETLDPNPEIDRMLREIEMYGMTLDMAKIHQPKQEEILLQEVTSYENPKSWFTFPEVDLHMMDRPEKGLYYVAGKVLELLDERSAIISDGTAERMLYHHKVQNLSVGDVIISQVEIYKSVWNFVHVWEINENVQEQKAV